MQHRSAPDHRLITRVKQAHRNQLYPLRLDRKYLPFTQRLRLLVRAQHDRNVRAINVGVEQTNGSSQSLQRKSQVNSNGRFPDAALPAGDRDKIFYALNGQFGGLRLRCWWRWHFNFSKKIVFCQASISRVLNAKPEPGSPRVFVRPIVKSEPGAASTRFSGSASS